METARQITERGGRAFAYKCDVANDKEMNSVADRIQREYGRVDILICNAAVLYMGRFLDLTNDQLRNSFDVNVIGVCNVSCF